MTLRSHVLLPTLCALTLGAGGCAGDASSTEAPSVENDNALHLRPARNLDIHVITWDHSIRRAAGATEDMNALLAHDRRGQISFTVIVELANRPAVRDGETDPLTNPAFWEFRLYRGADTDIRPDRVEVHTVDRFPTRDGGYHWRLALAVHFPAVRANADPGDEPGMILSIRPTADASRRRDSLGRAIAEHGIQARLR